MSTIGNINVKFSELYNVINNATHNGSSEIKMSTFRGTVFSNGVTVPSSGGIGIALHFRNNSRTASVVSDVIYWSHTFTTGNAGTTNNYLASLLATYQAEYSSTKPIFNNTTDFNVINGIQLWKVPYSGTWRITVASGGGGSTLKTNDTNTGGSGITISGERVLSEGQIIRIIVGSKGGSYEYTAGGGGASLVVLSNGMADASPFESLPWIMPGAGGGAGHRTDGRDGLVTEQAGSGNAGTYAQIGQGGTNSATTNGGHGGGGSGWLSTGGGSDDTGGAGYQLLYNANPLNTSEAPNGSFSNSWTNFNWPASGSCVAAPGGFGGGGGGGCNAGGAAAGYTGGMNSGAGGGSYFNTSKMSNRINLATNSGHGYVKMELVNYSNMSTLKNLATQLNNLTNAGIQSKIAQSNFTMLAKVKNGQFAETLPGLSKTDGAYTFADNEIGFIYNSTTSQLGNGENLITDSTLQKFMCVAIYSDSVDTVNSNFEGILVWSFNNTRVDNTAMTITNIASLFYNTGFTTGGTGEFWRVQPYFIKPDGSVVTGAQSGWRFSNGQHASVSGYHTTSVFSLDDGAWGVEFGANIDANSPGPNFSAGVNSYGIINYDSSDSTTCYIAGQSKSNFKGYVFYLSDYPR